MTKRDLALKIIKLLKKYHCDQDVAIYFDEKRFSCFDEGWKEENENMKDYALDYLCDENGNMQDDIELYMTFEGPFYYIMNYGENQKCLDEFDNIISKNGYWYEKGDYWNIVIKKD